MRRAIFAALLLVFVGGCASNPHSTGNVCSVFAQKNGWFTDWRSDAERTSAKYGVPVPILMATIYTESSFRARARPPRRYILGFIPWKRISTAYGYAQALDGTWDGYQSATGSYLANRHDFADAIDFVGWYHSQSHRRNGIALNDPYNLYLAYYVGQSGYSHGVWKNDAGALKAAGRTARMSRVYASQLASCR